MFPLVWLEPARADLRDIIEYISADNPNAAERLKAGNERALLLLAEHPCLYKSGQVPGTRELVPHPNYIVVYRVTAGRVAIVSVVDARRQYPPRR